MEIHVHGELGIWDVGRNVSPQLCNAYYKIDWPLLLAVSNNRTSPVSSANLYIPTLDLGPNLFVIHRLMYEEAQTHIFLLMKKDSYPRFIKSEQYKTLMSIAINPLNKKK